MKSSAAALTLSAALLGGCSWLELAAGSFGYPTTTPGAPANVVVAGGWAYATLGSAGIRAVELASGRSLDLPLLPGLESADDLATADGLLFVLDAQQPGHLGVLSLDDPAAPAPRGAPIPVDVGPFSGVSAGGGRVVVSGGTSRLSLRDYTREGRLGAQLATADLGRGQPDVLLDRHGAHAYVSTHYYGPYFGVEILALASPPSLRELGSLDIDSYGFTPGGAKPASFPLAAALDGSTLLVAFVRGLAALDVADPAHPRLLGVFDPGVRAVHVDASSGTAAIVGSSPRPLLALVDVRDPAHPRELARHPLPDGSLATGVALAPGYVAVAAQSAGLLVLDRNSGAWRRY